MSKIDWDGKLEAYHEDGRVMEITCGQPWSNEQWPMRGLAGGKYIFMGNYGVCRSAYGDMPGWNIRNVTEPKAAIEAWAIKIAIERCPSEWKWTPSEVLRRDDDAAKAILAFARYVMTKEEAPIDPDLIAAREVVCGYHHDKHPESPWHMEMAEQVRSGDRDGGPVMLVAYHAIKRGRELERGEGK